MKRFSLLAIALPLAAWQSSCSGCTDDPHGNSGLDTGSDTGGDGDTDADADGDTDGDTDTDTMPEGFVPDAGPWDWEDLPDADDCGQPGCRQFTFTETVRFLEWDVWGSLITFNDGETFNTRLVNTSALKQLLLPNVYPGIGIGPSLGSANLYPATIFENTVCYSRAVTVDPDYSDVICADVENETQVPVYHRLNTGTDFPNPANYVDIYGTRIVSMGGCGEVMDSWPLCAFDMGQPGTYEELAPHQYGLGNQIWGDIVVWESGPAGNYDIRAFDLSNEQFIEITDDTVGQMCPRIHGSRVVYQDLVLGDGNLMGNWNHSAVFMYDLLTQETTQITTGEWIAAYPDINENIIVWQDYRDSADPNDNTSFAGVQIWGYNLDTGIEFQITNLPDRPKQTPRIWGDKVFVHMYKTTPGQDAIYMFDLPPAAKAPNKK